MQSTRRDRNHVNKRREILHMSLTREDLKRLGIEGDAAEKVMSEYGKTRTELTDAKAKLEEANSQTESLQSQIDERDGQLATLKKSVGDNEELKGQIKSLQDANKQTKEEYQGKLAEQNKAFKIDTYLRDAKAKNPKAVKALLDADKVSVDGDNLVGLEDQVKGIQESDPYMFEVEEDNQNQNTKVNAFAGGNPSGDAGKGDISKMNYQQMLNFKQSNPKAFEAAKAEADK